MGGNCPTQRPLPSCRSDSQVTACESRESHGHPCGGVGRGQAQGLPDNGPAAAKPCPEVEGPGGHGAPSPAPTCRGQLHALLPFPTAGTEVGAFFPPAQSQPQTTPAPRADGAGHDGLGTKPPAPPARCWDRDVTPTAPAVHHRKPQPAACTPNPPTRKPWLSQGEAMSQPRAPGPTEKPMASSGPGIRVYPCAPCSIPGFPLPQPIPAPPP